MSLENPNVPDEQSGFESIRQEIARKIELASMNPLRTSRYLELEGIIRSQKDKFFSSGIKTPEDIELDQKIRDEIIASAAVVETVSEFEEMLAQVAEKYGFGDEWAKHMLAHENAHANVSEEVGFRQVGYGMFFLADDSGRLEAIQPAHIDEDPDSWTPLEVIDSGIRRIEAPAAYGNALSDADVEDREELLRIRKKLES